MHWLIQAYISSSSHGNEAFGKGLFSRWLKFTPSSAVFFSLNKLNLQCVWAVQLLYHQNDSKVFSKFAIQWRLQEPLGWERLHIQPWPQRLCCCRSQGEFSGFSSFHSCQVPSHPFSLVSVCLLLNFYNWMQLIICWLGNQITEPARILYKGREKLGLCKCLRNSLTKQISWSFFTYVFKAKEMSVCLFARNIQICSNCCI